ncbi:hypothetical protein NSP_23710 [Nodularia spumigena CCY9414]|nr:hypothetical protein NSP_23710 [Nodularia spumigena CCY9414]
MYDYYKTVNFAPSDWEPMALLDPRSGRKQGAATYSPKTSSSYC